MINNYTDRRSYKKIKIILLISFVFLISLVGLSHFLAYKIKLEGEKIAKFSQINSTKKDLHTLCMLDYVINPNGKDILKECKKIKIQQTKIDTPYLDFYFQYLQ